MRKVLVNAVNTATDTAGDASTLAIGQLGIYDAFTGQAIAPSASAVTREFYIALRTSATSLRTTGENNPINAARLRYARVHCHKAAVNKIVEVTKFCTDCNKDLTFKLIVKDPTKDVQFGMTNQIYAFTPSVYCCNPEDANACVTSLRAIRDQINANTNGIFTAALFNPDDAGDTGATALTDNALDAWDVSADGCPTIRITGNVVAALDFTAINYKYRPTRSIDFEIAVDGVQCCSPAVVITTIQELVYQEGSGYDVKQAENMALPYMGGMTPERIAEDVIFTGDLLAVATTSYIAIELEWWNPEVQGGANSDYAQNISRASIELPIGNTNAHNIAVYLDYLLNGATTPLATALAACLA